MPATVAIADFVRDLKTSTSVYLKENKDSFPKFDGWAKSYCALTYSYNEKDTIINYIKNQKEHHKKVSFRDELLEMLRESGVEVDMKYFMVDYCFMCSPHSGTRLGGGLLTAGSLRSPAVKHSLTSSTPFVR